MWQKLIAGACVMTGALGFGWSLCGEMNRDIQHLKMQKQILVYMMEKSHIYTYFSMEEIFDMVSEKAGSPYDAFFQKVSQRMKERDGMTLLLIWNETVQEMKMGTNVSWTGEWGIWKRWGIVLRMRAGSCRWRRLGFSRWSSIMK